jgi:hypothetical protein
VKVRGKNGNRGGPVRVAWYFSVIAHLKRMFATKKEVELLQWHKKARKKLGNAKLGTPQMQHNGVTLIPKWFVDDCRYIRFIISSNNVNPFGNHV